MPRRQRESRQQQAGSDAPLKAAGSAFLAGATRQGSTPGSLVGQGSAPGEVMLLTDSPDSVDKGLEVYSNLPSGKSCLFEKGEAQI